VSARTENPESTNEAGDHRPLFDVLQEARDRKAQELALKNNPAIPPQEKLDDADSAFLDALERKERSLRDAQRLSEDDEIAQFRRARAGIIYPADSADTRSEGITDVRKPLEADVVSTPRGSPAVGALEMRPRKLLGERLVVSRKRKREGDGNATPIVSPEPAPDCRSRQEEERQAASPRAPHVDRLVAYASSESSSSSSAE
jgi:hypothetical protein